MTSQKMKKKMKKQMRNLRLVRLLFSRLHSTVIFNKSLPERVVGQEEI